MLSGGQNGRVAHTHRVPMPLKVFGRVSVSGLAQRQQRYKLTRHLYARRCDKERKSVLLYSDLR